jgi:hypothetical protein
VSGERGSVQVDGRRVGPSQVGVDQQYVGAITPSDVTVYDPPLKKIRVGVAGAGNLVLVYAADDESVAANRDTVAVANNQVVSGFLIRQVRAATTATTLTGYR